MWDQNMNKTIEKAKSLRDPYWTIVENERRLVAIVKIQIMARKFLLKIKARNEKHQMFVVQDMLTSALSSVYDLLLRSLNNP